MPSETLKKGGRSRHSPSRSISTPGGLEMELTTSETYRYRTKSAKHEMDNFGNMTPSEHVSRSRGTKWKNDTPIFERLIHATFPISITQSSDRSLFSDG